MDPFKLMDVNIMEQLLNPLELKQNLDIMICVSGLMGQRFIGKTISRISCVS